MTRFSDRNPIIPLVPAAISPQGTVVKMKQTCRNAGNNGSCSAYSFSGSGYSAPKVSTVTLSMIWGSKGLSE